MADAPGFTVDGVLADAGYFSEDNVKGCEKAAGATPYIAVGRESHNLPWDERFAVPPPCPEDADAGHGDGASAYAPRKVKRIYAKRKSTVETVFGIIKSRPGIPAISSSRTARRPAGNGLWCAWPGI